MFFKKRQIENINLWKTHNKEPKNEGKDNLSILKFIDNNKRTKFIKNFKNNKEIFFQNAKLREIKLKKLKIKNFFQNKKTSKSLNQFSKFNYQNYSCSNKNKKNIFIKKFCKKFLDKSLNNFSQRNIPKKHINFSKNNKILYSSRYSKNKNFNSFLESKTKHSKRTILLKKFKKSEKLKKSSQKLNFLFLKNL